MLMPDRVDYGWAKNQVSTYKSSDSMTYKFKELNDHLVKLTEDMNVQEAYKISTFDPM